MSQLASTGRPIRSTGTVSVRPVKRESSSRKPSARARAPRASVRRTDVDGRVQAVSGSRQSGTGFMVLVGIIALMGVMGLLMLNTMRAEQSFTVARLQGDVSTLQQRQQQLQSDLSTVSSPENLAMKADSLGMVKAASVQYVRASDHKKLGVANVGSAGKPLNVETLPDTPATKVASQMLTDGTIGSRITDPAAEAAAAAKAKAAKQRAESQKASPSSAAKH